MDIFRRLGEYARTRPDLPPPCYRMRPVRWVLDLRFHTNGGVPAASVVPFPEKLDAIPVMRRSGAKPMPFLAVDNATHVLGQTGPRATEKQASARAQAFWQQMGEWAAGPHSHPAAGAALVVMHMAGGAASAHEVAPDDLVAVRVDGILLHRLPEAVAAWSGIVSARKTSGRTGLCVACGQRRSLADTLPNAIARPLMPGAEWDVQLTVPPPGRASDVSGMPVCVPCGDLAASALEMLLADREHSARRAGQSSAVVWFGVGDRDADRRVTELMALIGS